MKFEMNNQEQALIYFALKGALEESQGHGEAGKAQALDDLMARLLEAMIADTE